MNHLKEIKASPKTGNENLTDNGTNLQHKLVDFWSWSVSDLLSNTTRGRFAEFIVGSAIGLDLLEVREEWVAYDLLTKNGIKIEVKSSSYIQNWEQNKYSEISFSIRPAKEWDYVENKRSPISNRHSDIYVFCHLKHKDKTTINPLQMEQWDFYVVATKDINNKLGNQGTIRLSSLQKFASPILYKELNKEIERVYKNI